MSNCFLLFSTLVSYIFVRENTLYTRSSCLLIHTQTQHTHTSLFIVLSTCYLLHNIRVQHTYLHLCHILLFVYNLCFWYTSIQWSLLTFCHGVYTSSHTFFYDNFNLWSFSKDVFLNQLYHYWIKVQEYTRNKKKT